MALAAGGVALGVSVVSGIGGAAAQSVDPGLFTVEDAGTRKLLAFLSDFSDAGSPVLGQMLGAFNAGVMFLAGFLLIWNVMTGAVETGSEGRWKFPAWVWVRIVVAVVLMAPLPGGASGAQHIVLGLARVGGDFANLVWEPLAVETLGKGRSVVAWPNEGAWRRLLGRTLVAEVCAYVANEEAAAAGEAAYVRVRTERERREREGWVAERAARLSPAEPATSGLLAEVVHYDGVGRGMPGDLCGSVRFAGLNQEGGRGIAARGHRDAWLAVRSSIAGVAREVGDHFVIGKSSYGKALPDIADLLDGVDVADSYRAVLETRVKAAGDAEQQALVEAVRKDAEDIEWLAAASFVNTLAASAAKIQAAAWNVPEGSMYSPDLRSWSPAGFRAVEAVVRGLAQDGGYEVVPVAGAAGVAGALAPTVGRGGSHLDRIMKFIDVESVLVADSGNPLLDLASTGFAVMNGALLAMLALSGVSVGSNFVGLVPSLDVFEAGWQVLDGIVTPVIGLMIVAGAVLGYVLPAIPFIRFLFGILAWLLAVVEAILAVTVFCAAHVQRGEDNRLMLPETRAGWLFLPGLILRPVLMLFGLVIGYFVFVALMGLFNEIWVPRMVDANAASGLGPIDFLAMFALYVMVAYGLLNGAFKLIDILPSAVLGWIGGQGSGDTGGEGVMGVATGGFGRAGALSSSRGLGRGGGRGAAPAAGPSTFAQGGTRFTSGG